MTEQEPQEPEKVTQVTQPARTAEDALAEMQRRVFLAQFRGLPPTQDAMYDNAHPVSRWKRLSISDLG